MIIKLICILLAGFLSLKFTDLQSESVFFSWVLPVCFFISLIALAIWAVSFFYQKGISQNTTSRGGSGVWFDGGSGDC